MPFGIIIHSVPIARWVMWHSCDHKPAITSDMTLTDHKIINGSVYFPNVWKQRTKTLYIQLLHLASLWV